MDDHHQLKRIILMMMLMTTTQATIIQNNFKKLQPGHKITGKTGSEQTARSNIHCSIMYRTTKTCEAYQYKKTGPENCILIDHNSTAAEGEIFKINASKSTYVKNLCENEGELVNSDHGYQCECVDGYTGNHCEEEDNCFNGNNCTNGTKCVDGTNGYTCICNQDSEGTWTKPSIWTGPDPVLYRSFDNMEGLIFMEGTEQREYAPLFLGQVNCAWSVDRAKRQWIDLGFHTEACMSHMSCGAAGGAISLWLKVIDCPDGAGILSSHQSSTGFRIYCIGNSLWFQTYLTDGYFDESASSTNEWTLVQWNYIGPNEGEGIRIYYDGTQVANDTTKTSYPLQVRYRRIVVGRMHTDRDDRYASVQVDELVLFNQGLTPSEVIKFYN